MKPYYEASGITIYHGDCQEILPQLPPCALVLTDPNYGTTACRWDCPFDLDEWWKLVWAIISGESPAVVFCAQPFTTKLINSQINRFRYCWVWEKQKPTNFLSARSMPLRAHEDIAVFSETAPRYNPQGLIPVRIKQGRANKAARGVYSHVAASDYIQTEGNFPRSVLYFETDTDAEHETAKPIALLEYLILTYTDHAALVTDVFMGGGSTLVAAKNLGRKAIGIDNREECCEIAAKRLSQEVFSF